MEKYAFGGAFLVFILSFFFFSLLYLNSKTVQVPVSSNLYTEGLIGQPTFINPVISGGNDVDNDLSEIVFGNLEDLIDYYKVDESGKVWNIFLKSDLKWSDGKPLTSDDVVYTIETIQDPSSRSPLFATWQGVAAERISELEIEFNLRAPYAFFLDNLNKFKVIPKHIFGIIPPSNFRLSDYNLEPVGSGPYKFVSYDKRKDGFITAYHFATNENYATSTPFIRNFDVSFFQDTAEIIKAFNNKKIDGFGNLDPKKIADIKISRKFIEAAMPRYYAVFFNPNSHEALKEKIVRQAMELATDKKKIVEKIFDNKALIVNGPLLPTMTGYNPATESSQEFSVEKSAELLEKNGWTINKDSGIREKKIGSNIFKLEFDVVVPQIQFLIDTANIMKEDWKNAGINLNPVVLSPSEINDEVIKTRNYQMIIFGNILKNNPDIFSFWHSSERFYPGLNLAIYENKKVDELLESARKELKEEKRIESLGKLQELINEDKPAIFLYSPAYIYVGPKDLGGFTEEMISSSAERFNGLNKWHLRTVRVFK
ncbi:MAG: peptide ABC transporter substrate-binding protein [Candidatus Pacebacteria bacterium]|nr:peptide ABC transporter substrate-binding protein [Candidatus Paceibacterota bacterium]